jgi:hypothetical protein
MPFAMPHSVRTIIDNFESKETGFHEVAITAALRTAMEGRTFDNDDERAVWWAEWAAFSLIRRPDVEPSVWGTTYGPIATLTRDDGPPSYSPDMADADAKTVEYWDTRSMEAKNPILIARYSDLVWDFAKSVGKIKPPLEAAQRAIDAYVQAAKIPHESAIPPIRFLERALDLAQSIGDKDRTATVASAMFQLYEKSASPQHAGSWPFLYDELVGNKKAGLSKEQEDRIIALLEAMLKRSSDRTNAEEFNPWGAQAAAERLARYYGQKRQTDEARRVIRTYGLAFEHMAESASPTLAMAWLQPICEAYLSAGLREDATRVQLASKRKGERAHEDMRQVSATIEIPTKKMAEFMKEITSGGLEFALRKIAVRFTTSTTHARNLLKDITARSPLQAMIGITKIGDAQIIAKADSVIEDPEGRTIWQLAQLIEIESMFLSEALQRVRELYAPDPESIAKLLYRSPIYNQLQRTLIVEGLDAYIRSDFVKAIHVLIPQVENALRHLMSLMNVPTNKLMRGGIMQEKTLGDILTDPAVNTVFEEDTINYLQTFLNDPRGQNVRNRVSHGLCQKEFFSQLIADRVLHILFSIGRVAEAVENTEPVAAAS